jgi:hypothetical protein
MYQLKKGDLVTASQETPFTHDGTYWRGEAYTARDPDKTRFEMVEVSPIISPVEFKLLFTSTERTAIKAARSDTSTPEATQIKAVLDDWYEILDDPRLKEVNLGLSSTIAGVNFLESVGLIDPGRATEILTGTIS